MRATSRLCAWRLGFTLRGLRRLGTRWDRGTLNCTKRESMTHLSWTGTLDDRAKSEVDLAFVLSSLCPEAKHENVRGASDHGVSRRMRSGAPLESVMIRSDWSEHRCPVNSCRRS